MKIYKYVVGLLIILASLIQIRTIYVVSSYLILQNAQHPIDSNIFRMILISILMWPIIYVICYLLSLFLIIKNKTVGYLISGVVSFVIFIDALNQMVKNNISFDFIMIITSIFWIALIVLSFIARYKFEKDKKSLPTDSQS